MSRLAPRFVVTAGLAVLVLLVSATAALAAPGDLDTSFHADGRRTTDFGGNDLGNAIAVQDDGRIVVAGSGTGNFQISRYTTSGLLDSSFSGDGKSANDLGSTSEGARAAAIQADGKIVVAGFTFRRARGFEFALMRYNGNGTLDTSFDGDGKLITDFVGSDDIAHAVEIQTNGKIVVAGEAFSPRTGLQFAMARYHTNGALDTTFSGDGKRMANHPGTEEAAYDLALQPDGKLVLAGWMTDDGFNTDLLVGRFTPSGNNDATFSVDGWSEPEIVGGDAEVEVATSVAIRAEDEILIGGYANPTADADEVAFLVLQLTPAGLLDTAWGEEGGYTFGFVGDFDAFGHDLVLQEDHKIIVVGTVVINAEGDNDMGVLRLDAGGAPDASFGTNGEVITDEFGGDTDAWFSAALQEDGKLVTAGTTDGPGGDLDVAVARYLTA